MSVSGGLSLIAFITLTIEHIYDYWKRRPIDVKRPSAERHVFETACQSETQELLDEGL
jgi:hypothetical protein